MVDRIVTYMGASFPFFSGCRCAKETLITYFSIYLYLFINIYFIHMFKFIIKFSTYCETQIRKGKEEKGRVWWITQRS